MGIVTKTGDKGTTGTLGGERVLKSSSLIELNGQIDELNSSLGYLCSLIDDGAEFQKKKELTDFIRYIQNGLYNMGSEISSKYEVMRFNESHPRLLEEKIDELTQQMPEQTHFILFSGTRQATYTHVTRSLARRAERQYVRYLLEEEIETFPQSYMFLNRLSDYLFTLARYLNQELGGVEIIATAWK